MLTTNYLEDYILSKKNGVDEVKLGGIHGHRLLREHFLSRPTVYFDLNEGYDGSWEEEEDHKSLSVLLQWLILKSPGGNLEKVLSGAKVVSRRGVLSRMAQGQYLKEKGDWQIVCEKRRGTIFLQEEMTQKELNRRATASQLEKSATYWGKRFEEYMVENKKTEDDLARSFSSLSIENKNDDIRLVMTATLVSEDMKLLYSGEIDAIDSEGRHVELKTTSNRGFGYWFWKEKSLKWWMQSRLVGVDYILVGLRDSHGRVCQLRKMTLDELKNKEWSADECFSFLYEVLKIIDRSLSEGEAARVNCTSGRLSMTKISSTDAAILTKEFKEHFKL